MRNENQNILFEMGCPECFSSAPFLLEVRGSPRGVLEDTTIARTVEMWDDGFDDQQLTGHTSWDEDSPCACVCGYKGTARDFRLVSALELLARCADQDEEQS